MVVPLPGRGHGRSRGPLLAAWVVSTPDPGPDRTLDRGVTPDPQARPGPFRRHRRGPGVDGPSGPGPERGEPAGVDGPSDRTGDPPHRDQPLRRVGPHRREETRLDPTGRGPQEARPRTGRSSPTSRLHPHPHRDRRLLAAGLFGVRRRRERCEACRVLGPGGRLVHRSGDHHRTDPHGQRHRLPLPRLGRPLRRARDPPFPHRPLPAGGPPASRVNNLPSHKN